MTSIRPRFPNDRRIADNGGNITTAWDYYFRNLNLQLPDPGAFAITSAYRISINTSGRDLDFRTDGSTYAGTTLHFPSLNGDVSNSGLTTTLKSVGTPQSNVFSRYTTDYAGRVIASTPVISSDITPLIDSTYVNVVGDTMTGVLALPALQFDTAATPTPQIGQLQWNAADGTLDLPLSGGNVTLQIGQEQVFKGVNKSGANVVDGAVVALSGAQGNRISFTLANAGAGPINGKTIGVVTEPILNNGEGYITTSGLIRGLDTSSFTEGDRLWLSTTPGVFTNVKPTAPNHVVQVGYVVRAHAVVGSIFVAISIGADLGELDNVVLTSPTTGQFLKFDGTVWVNSSVVGTAASADKLTTARTINGTAFDGTANISFNTDAVAEGGTNLYYTTARARSALSASGNIVYNSSTGAFTSTAANSNGTNATGTWPISITGASATASSATTAGTVTTAAQPAITSVGVLSSLTTSGNVGIGAAATQAAGAMKLYITGAAAGDGVSMTVDNTAPSGYASYRLNNGPGGGSGTASSLHLFGSSFPSVVQYKANGTNLNGGGSGGLSLSTTTNAIIDFWVNNTYRMQINPGSVLVNTTAVPSAAGSGMFCVESNSATVAIPVAFSDTRTDTNGSAMVQIVRRNVLVGQITTTSSTTAYTTTSDYRLKKNVQPMQNSLDKICRLNPVTYTWKSDELPGEGFIAHELQEIFPTAVTGLKDELNDDGTPKYQSIDTSFIVGTLVSAMQEQQVLIEQLSKRLAILENNVNTQ